MKLDVFKFTKAVRLLSGLVGLVIIIFPQSALELFLPSLDRRREFFLRNCISTDQPNMSYIQRWPNKFVLGCVIPPLATERFHAT